MGAMRRILKGMVVFLGSVQRFCAMGLVFGFVHGRSGLAGFFDAIWECIHRSMRPVSERDETAALEEREGEAPSLGGLAGNPRATSKSKQFEPQTSDPTRAGNVSALSISFRSRRGRPANKTTNLNSSQQG